MKEKGFSFGDNSLDLIRMFAALQIALTHYLNLTLLRYGVTGWQDSLLLGAKRIMTLFPGLILLFSISGFLMGASMERSKGPVDFLKKRVLRIYPGLWTAILVMAAMVLLLLRPKGADLKALGIWMGVQAAGLAYTPDFLQGFATGSMNGTLWTIMVEIQLYLLLGFFWKPLKRLKSRGWNCLLLLALFLNLLCGWAQQASLLPAAALSLLSRTFFPYLVWFAAGLWLYRFRETVLPVLQKKWPLLLGFYVLYKGGWQVFGWPVPGYYADVVTSLWLPCAAVAAAYGWGKHRLKNDLSYGIFLYHWPVINLIFFWNLPAREGHLLLFAGYVLAFLLLGCLSWFVVERRILHGNPGKKRI